MTTFHPFPRLPGELRNKIWEATLPPRLPHASPALFPFHKSVWAPHWCVPYESVRLEFSTAQLSSPTTFAIPIAHANSEARSIAVPFIRAAGLSAVKKGPDQRCPHFARFFDLALDSVYVTLPQWGEFVLTAPMDRMEEPDVEGLTYSEWTAEMQRLAVPAALVQDDGWAAELLMQYACIREVLVVVEGDAGLGVFYAGGTKGPVAGVQDVGGKKYVWDWRGGRFDVVGGKEAEDTFAWIEGALGSLGEEFEGRGFTLAVEVRPVRAVKG